MELVRRHVRSGDGLPIYTYAIVPGVPPVGVVRLDRDAVRAEPDAHAHDFPALAFFERGGGSLRSATREWPVASGDAFIVAPGEVMGAGNSAGLEEAEGWGVFFTPEVFGSEVSGSFLSWRSHPLLLPFARGTGEGVLRLRVSADDRAAWSERCVALDSELRERKDGYREAVLAQLTLLLVDVSRLAADVVGDLKLNQEPLLAEVFRVIEERYPQRISLRDVAHAVSLSPGHLTTMVRRRTGRTVQQWITERRMAQARRLLVETNKAVAEVGRRVGYDDPAYFIRSFRKAHNITPLQWRRAGRP